jgi:hypothetical protein
MGIILSFLFATKYRLRDIVYRPHCCTNARLLFIGSPTEPITFKVSNLFFVRNLNSLLPSTNSGWRSIELCYFMFNNNFPKTTVIWIRTPSKITVVAPFNKGPRECTNVQLSNQYPQYRKYRCLHN